MAQQLTSSGQAVVLILDQHLSLDEEKENPPMKPSDHQLKPIRQSQKLRRRRLVKRSCCVMSWQLR